MQIYVNAAYTGLESGTAECPFRTISQAAAIARPGDEVLVYPGIYREAVDPVNSGTEADRITYRSVEPLGAVITGAEPVNTWIRVKDTVWEARIDNDVFGGFNPYERLVSGDWFIATMVAHLGDVYLNHRSMYEVLNEEEVYSPVESLSSWDREFSRYVWYTRQDGEKNETVILANFHEYDPNTSEVEISVRPNCFYPSKEGVSYITLSGFTVREAATQWAPPTAYQEGMVGPHWSKGWIIEDCEIYEAKCSGISLGKYRQEGNDNKWLKEKYKDGTQTERECILQAWREGWSKDRIGSHIVRRCNIHDCGQTGIVGHLGGVFSLIEDNHIHHINNKQNLAGAEIGGIKMHAAIDVVLRRNHIHHCTRGLWLDWQAQGTRVSCNLFHDNTLPFLPDEPVGPEFLGNGEDVFIEVSHGPTLLDNNYFLSQRALKLATQGVAVVHNIIAGSFVAVGTGTDNGAKTLTSPRYTPYHVPHETDIAGFMTFLHGDSRFYNNIFIQQPVKPALKAIEDIDGNNAWDDNCVSAGTFRYNGYPTYDEWNKEFDGYCGMGSAPSDRYYMHLPVWTGGNVFFNGAKPYEKEENFAVDSEHDVQISVVCDDGRYTVETNVYDYLPAVKCELIDTAKLGKAFEPEQYYENPDGSPIVFDTDYEGKKRSGVIIPGPLA